MTPPPINMTDDIPSSLRNFIDTRDRRLAKVQPWSPQRLAETFATLLEKGMVTVGGRSSCGCYDHSMQIYRCWNEVVAKARKAGYLIAETDIKHGNGWATKAGGFWNEKEYRFEGLAGAEGGA